MPNHDVALDRAGTTVFRDITFLAAGPGTQPFGGKGNVLRKSAPYVKQVRRPI